MRIAVAQINPTLGDFKNNADKILEFIKRASEKRAHLVVFSEMCLFGYPAYDLLEYEKIVDEQLKELHRIHKNVPENLTVIVGAINKNPNFKKSGKPFTNSAFVLKRGKKPIVFNKQLLPSYDVFDETRFFEPGDKTGRVNVPGVGQVAITICEDIWADLQQKALNAYPHDPLHKVKADLVVNLSASPFSKNKNLRRLKCVKNHTRRLKTPFVYVNQVGSQDEIIFDGRSFAMDAKARLMVQASGFEEDLVIIDFEKQRTEHRPQIQEPHEVLRRALVLGIQDFISKTNQKSVHLGLSGGIDSSVVAALAVDALGPRNVRGILLPGPFSSSGSIEHSLQLAKNLRIETTTLDINPVYDVLIKSIKVFPNSSDSLLSQNLQARIRGLLLMAYSNATQSLLLSTTNKSEIASGYGTLYGDLIGGLCPIADLTKNEVYSLAKLYNQDRPLIPLEVLTKPPSAELAPNQTDQETLPPYDILDKAVVNIIEKRQWPKTDTEKWLWSALLKHEFKRWQFPPILRVSDHAFGRGRRMPIARR